MEKFKLPKKVKDKWVKALRSGEYEKGVGELHNKLNNTFCCLGVLRDLKLTRKEYSWESLGKKYIPHEIQDFLSMKNDHESWSFKRSATWIDKNL